MIAVETEIETEENEEEEIVTISVELIEGDRGPPMEDEGKGM